MGAVVVLVELAWEFEFDGDVSGFPAHPSLLAVADESRVGNLKMVEGTGMLLLSKLLHSNIPFVREFIASKKREGYFGMDDYHLSLDSPWPVRRAVVLGPYRGGRMSAVVRSRVEREWFLLGV